MMSFVHKMTSGLARTLTIGTCNVFCMRNPKINCFWVIVHVCLNLGAGQPSLKKVCGTIWKMKISFFYVFYTIWTFSNPKMKSCSFSISSQFNFKNGHFLKPSNRQNGNFNIHKQMIIQMIFMASCIEEIYLKVLDKQASWTYVRLIFELFLVISWLWFALDHLRCWEDWC